MPRSLNEIRYGMATEGDKMKLPALEGAPLLIESFTHFESDFAPGACVQCTLKDNKIWFVTHSEFVIATLELMNGTEPYFATPTLQKSASDRTYITLE